MNLSALILLKHKQNLRKQKKSPCKTKKKKSIFGFLNFWKRKQKNKQTIAEPKISEIKKEHSNGISFSEVEAVKTQKKEKSKKISIWKMLVFVLLLFVLAKGVMFFLVSQGMFGHAAVSNIKKDSFHSTSTIKNSKNIYVPKKNGFSENKEFQGDANINKQKPISLNNSSAQAAKKYGNPGVKTDKKKKDSNAITPKQLFKIYCGSNRDNIAEHIKFLISNRYDFAYLSKKYKKGDSLIGLGRKDLFVDLVYPTEGGKRAIDIRDGKGNICTVVVPWNKGLKIKIFYHAIDVIEQETQNIRTFLVGDSFNHVTLTKIKIINGVKTAFFKTASNKIIKFTEKQNEVK